MKTVSCTSHIGRSNHEKNSGKNTSISSAGDLGATETHNNHEYTKEDVARMQSYIDLDLKSHNVQFDRSLQVVDRLELVDAVKQIYHEEFDQAVENYNQKMIEKGKKDRCIDNYFEHISNSKKQEIAVEGILQVGEFEDWKDIPLDMKKKVLPIYLKALNAVLEGVPGFKLAGASFHINEGSPHLQYVGVCVDDAERKTGMEKRIGKAAVFTREVLSEILQDKVREVMEPMIQKEFGWEFEEKQTGRNKDLSKNEWLNNKLQNENAVLKEQLEVREQQVASLDHQLVYCQAQIEQKEKQINVIESFSEYKNESQGIYNMILQQQQMLRHMEEAKVKKLFKGTKDADEWIEKMKELLLDLREQIERGINRLKHFEIKYEVPVKEQRSRTLEERIKTADIERDLQDKPAVLKQMDRDSR